MDKQLLFRLSASQPWHVVALEPNGSTLCTCKRFQSLTVTPTGRVTVTVAGATPKNAEMRWATSEEIKQLQSQKRICALCKGILTKSEQCPTLFGGYVTSKNAQVLGLNAFGDKFERTIVVVNKGQSPCPVCGQVRLVLSLGIGKAAVEVCEECLNAAVSMGKLAPENSSVTLTRDVQGK